MKRSRALLSCALLCGTLLAPSYVRADETGWADLHAHPMTHLAFGHNGGLCADSEGIFHGEPGGAFDAIDLSSDLGTCETDTHSKCPTTLVERGIRTWLLGLLENRYPAHGEAGAPSFEFWPHALSRTHQQMHVKWLRHAWESGQRIMIASMTESELLARVYHWEEGATCVVPDSQPGQLHAVAVKQIDGIRELVDANSDWLALAEDPATAHEAAFEEDKLVLVLGLEMDNLTDAEVLDLVDLGVRSVIPVHLTDNDVGGTAAFSDLFNALNYWQNGAYYDVYDNPLISFRLSDPRHIEGNHAGAGCGFGLSDPESVYPDPSCFIEEGHANTCGLRSNALIYELMRRGVIVDVAHMSQAAAEDTISMAELLQVPLINSHTALRDGHALGGGSERDMTYAHTQRIARLGGMIGLGTMGDPPSDVFFRAKGGPLLRVSDEQPEWIGYHLPTDTRDPNDVLQTLKLRIQTGEDNLRDDSEVSLVLEYGTPGSPSVFTETIKAKNDGSWDDWSVQEVDVDVSGLMIEVDDVLRVGLELDGDESWNINRFDVTYSGRDVFGRDTGNLLLSRAGYPYQRLTDGQFSTTTQAVRQREETYRDYYIDALVFEWGADFYSETGGGWSNTDSVFRLHLADGTVRERSFADMIDMEGDGEFGSGESAFRWPIAHSVCGTRFQYGDIVSLEVVTSLAHTNEIKVENLRVSWEGEHPLGGAVGGVLVDNDVVGGLGDVTHWLRRDRLSAELWRGLDPDPGGPMAIRVVRTDFETGGDDLEAGSEATLELLLRDGSVISRSLNRGAKWVQNTSAVGFLPPDDPVDQAEVVAVRVQSDRAGGIDADNWSLQGFELARAADPMQPWVDDFVAARTLIDAADADEGRVALGTDFNGLETQMPFLLLEDPVDTETLENLPVEDVQGGDETLDRTFTLEQDGLAHYGLLPDFINQAGALDARVVPELYQTAPAFVRMWASAVERGAELPDEAPTLSSVGDCAE